MYILPAGRYSGWGRVRVAPLTYPPPIQHHVSPAKPSPVLRCTPFSSVLCSLFYPLYRLSSILYVPVLCSLPFVLYSLSTVLCSLSFVLCPLSSVFCSLSYVLCSLSSVLCSLSSVLCPLVFRITSLKEILYAHKGQE